jgi:hypothetical protein
MEKLYYSGSSTFTVGSTSFGYYDNDVNFQLDADRVIRWVARQIGYPIVDVELTNEQLYDAFESAITIYSREIYNFKLRDNFGSLDGSQVPNDPNFDISKVTITPSLGAVIRMAKMYGSESLIGGNIKLYSGSIDLHEHIQTYDLKQWAITSGSMRADEQFEIKQIFYQKTPAVNRIYDPTMGGVLSDGNIINTTGLEDVGYATYGTNYLMMPIDFDILRIQAVEFNDQIRRSGYSFQLMNNELRIFPLPVRDSKLHFNYIKVAERDASFNPTLLQSGSTVATNPNTTTITNVSNVPYRNMSYTSINSAGKDWIMNMTLAISMRMLGMVRGKSDRVPLANNESITLNQQDLFTQADKKEIDLLQQLREMLEATSRSKQLERQAQDKNYMQDTLSGVAMPFYIF